MSNVYGTEEDKLNCPFYFKIGACRHGEKCTRIHNKPVSSQTILLKNLYQNTREETLLAEGKNLKEEDLINLTKNFEDFYEDIFVTLMEYGKIEDLNVCDNLGYHLIGNVYVKFSTVEEAKTAVSKLQNKFYDNRTILAEFTPVTDFKDSRCRQYDDGKCTRGAFCNFMHLKPISSKFKNLLYEKMYSEYPQYKKRTNKFNDRSKSRRSRSRSRSYSRDGDCKFIYIF